MPQIGSLDSTQVAQILRNLPGLLNKVKHHTTTDFLCAFLLLAMWLVNAIRDLGPMTLIARDGISPRSLELHVIALRTYTRFDLPHILTQRARGVSLFHHGSRADDLILIA